MKFFKIAYFVSHVILIQSLICFDCKDAGKALSTFCLFRTLPIKLNSQSHLKNRIWLKIEDHKIIIFDNGQQKATLTLQQNEQLLSIELNGLNKLRARIDVVDNKEITNSFLIDYILKTTKNGQLKSIKICDLNHIFFN